MCKLCHFELNMWEQLTPRETEVCERLILNQRRVNNNDRYILERLYRRFAIPPDRHSEIVLAVALVYDRHPHLRVDDSLLRIEASNCERPIRPIRGIRGLSFDRARNNDWQGTDNRPTFYRTGFIHHEQ